MAGDTTAKQKEHKNRFGGLRVILGGRVGEMGFDDERSIPPMEKPNLRLLGSLANFQRPNLRVIEGGLRTVGSALTELGTQVIGIAEKPEENENLTPEQEEQSAIANFRKESYKIQEQNRVNVGQQKETEAIKDAARFDPEGMIGIEVKTAKKASNAALDRVKIRNIGNIAFITFLDREDKKKEEMDAASASLENGSATGPTINLNTQHKEGNSATAGVGDNAG